MGTYFNSRPCERGDLVVTASAGDPIVFQFTPLREGRPSSHCHKPGDNLFQFTPLREGRHSFHKVSQSRFINFNSRPCERGDVNAERIHTLAVFQFTPLREGRRIRLLPTGAWSLFQFTPLREGRLRRKAHDIRDISISIHAPARGATSVGIRHTGNQSNFNSRPCERGDLHQQFFYYILLYFNSRPCERGDSIRLDIK